jgi:hypothetical protein
MNIDFIRHLNSEYESGRRDPEALLAHACLEAYEQGFEDGVHEAQQASMRAQILLHCTAGNA